MIPLFKSVKQMINGLFAKYEQLRINAENEFQAMSCGAFNPRFLAKIKKTRVDNEMIKKTSIAKYLNTRLSPGTSRRLRRTLET